MKVRVSYKQKYEYMVYRLYRIIDFTPHKRWFKNVLKDAICSTSRNTKIDYCKKVKSILSMTKEEVKDWILPDIQEYLSDPEKLYDKINNIKIDLDIDIG